MTQREETPTKPKKRKRRKKRLTKKQKEQLALKQRKSPKEEMQEARYRKYLRIHRLFMSVSILAVLSLGTATFTRFYMPETYQSISSTLTALTPFATAPPTSQQVGSEISTDKREQGVYNFLLLGNDDGHGNADTIIILHFNTNTGEINLISVPRDTLVSRTWSSYPKLNAAAGKGIDVITEELTSTLGVPIDYYVQVDLDAFIAIVDALGGIDYNVPQRMYHDDEGGFIIDLQAGQQWLDGRHTLELVRYRGYATADIGRTETQQAVLKILALKLLEWNNITRISEFIDIFHEYVNTNLSTADILWFAKSVLSHKDTMALYSQTLEGRGDAVSGAYRWCYELDQTATLETVNQYLNPFQDLREATDLNIKKADNYNS